MGRRYGKDEDATFFLYWKDDPVVADETHLKWNQIRTQVMGSLQQIYRTSNSQRGFYLKNEEQTELDKSVHEAKIYRSVVRLVPFYGSQRWSNIKDNLRRLAVSRQDHI